MDNHFQIKINLIKNLRTFYNSPATCLEIHKKEILPRIFQTWSPALVQSVHGHENKIKTQTFWDVIESYELWSESYCACCTQNTVMQSLCKQWPIQPTQTTFLFTRIFAPVDQGPICGHTGMLIYMDPRFPCIMLPALTFGRGLCCRIGYFNKTWILRMKRSSLAAKKCTPRWTLCRWRNAYNFCSV